MATNVAMGWGGWVRLMILFGAVVAASDLRAQMPRLELSVGMYRIDAEIAANDADRQRGLMFRKEMRTQEGMLFVFDYPEKHCMWMKNTLIPLSVAYLDDDGRVVNIEDMAPQTEDSHCALQPVRFALEMNRGWFAQKGLKKGATIRGLPALSAPR
jgi:uncharacterized membrane protein (UPF0127 family)